MKAPPVFKEEQRTASSQSESLRRPNARFLSEYPSVSSFRSRARNTSPASASGSRAASRWMTTPAPRFRPIPGGKSSG